MKESPSSSVSASRVGAAATRMKPAIVTPESLTRTATSVSTPKDFSAVDAQRAEGDIPRAGGRESDPLTGGTSPWGVGASQA